MCCTTSEEILILNICQYLAKIWIKVCAISNWLSNGTEPLSLTIFEIAGPTHVNERNNKHTRQQSRHIAIPPGRDNCYQDEKIQNLLPFH